MLTFAMFLVGLLFGLMLGFAFGIYACIKGNEEEERELKETIARLSQQILQEKD
jgi:ABC-type dipeptide/oligopeptide/nickel transport system permease component